MNNLVIDMTHGGVKIAISLAKKGKNVLACDIYNTLSRIDLKMLEIYNIDLVELEDLSEFKGDMRVIHPIHLPLSHEEIKNHNPNLNWTFTTHHNIIGEILNKWGEDLLKVEITGVKGKTSSAFMLKEILIDENPVMLSSLGALLYENKNRIILKKDISITPANIKETIDLAYKIANPICRIAEGKVVSENLRKYSSAIFECSLGGCGIGDVGLLTNIAEDYPIANNRLTASEAKKQIFNCRIVACEKESFDKYYPDYENANTFSISDSSADLYLKNVKYSLDKTNIEIEYKNVKTINNNIISGNITLKTFAPGKYHVSNVLGVVLTCLSLEIPPKKITEKIGNYVGIPGRTTKKTVKNNTIIEEINPGINTKAIEESITMIKNFEDYIIAIGGDYGITCEEIDEKKLSSYLNNLENEIILVGDVGASIASKINKKYLFYQNYNDVYDLAANNNKNLLFIYRSDYRNISQR